MASCQMTRHNAHALLASLAIILCATALEVASAVTPASLAGAAVAQPAHAGAHHKGGADGGAGGLDRFQTGMIVGFVTFAVLALCMMLLILYFLVRGTRRELRKAQVELAELREQRRQDAASDRLQLHLKGRASELRCIVNPDATEDDEEEDDDSSDLVICRDEVERGDDGYEYHHGPPSPSYDNYTYVAMGTPRNASHGRKKARAPDFIIEN